MYSLLNMLVIAIGGMSSAYLGGMISDHYSQRNALTKGYLSG